MSGEFAPKKIGRGFERNLDAGVLQPMVSSFELHLNAAERRSPKTIRAKHPMTRALPLWLGVKGGPARHRE